MKKIKLAIIGSGPAGYTAAIYASRGLLEPHLFTGLEMGGQLIYTTEVDNFPGFPQGIKGPQLMQQMQEQAVNLGTELIAEMVTAIDFSQQPFQLWLGFPKPEMSQQFLYGEAPERVAITSQIKQRPADYEAQAVIISTGATSIMLNLENEQRLLGRGISTCAVCDAAFFKNKQVYVVGGGNTAMVDALALAKYTDQVTIIHRRDQFRASRVMQQRVLDHPHIKVLWETAVVGLQGQQKLEQIQIQTTASGQASDIQTLPADGLFLAIGHKPMTQLFENQLKLDQAGYLVTAMTSNQEGSKMAQNRVDESGLVKYPSMTSVPGVFAAGDVMSSHHWQAIIAAGTGAAAALDAEHWLEAK